MGKKKDKQTEDEVIKSSEKEGKPKAKKPGVESLNILQKEEEINSKLDEKSYERELSPLQIELVRLQEWIKYKGLRVVVIFEGRDAAGKGGTILKHKGGNHNAECRMMNAE